MISAVVLVKNEEKNIERCINSLLWSDEILVIDDYSIDSTLDKIQNPNFQAQNKFKILKHKLEGDFSNQRNFGLEKASGEWVLFVDADEVVSEGLKNEIISICHAELVSASKIPNQVRDDNREIVGYYLKRRDFFEGRWLKHGETADVKLLRLARKGSGKWQRRVHEKWQVEGVTGNLTSPLLHYPHQTLGEFLGEINSYSTTRAKELHNQGAKAGFWQIIFYPKIKFLQNYFWRMGFLDGMPGLIMAVGMSFHSFLVRSKLYMLRNSK